MSNYVRRHVKGVTGGRRRREMAAATVPFPDDIHTFIDEYMNNKYGYPGIRSFPCERHLAYLTTDPYHIRRIPHSVHNKLSRCTDTAAVAARRTVAKNALSFAAAAAQGSPVTDDDPPPPPASGDSVLMKHAGLVGGFNIDDTYRYKVEKMAFRDSLIYEVRKWIDAYKKSIQQQQQQQENERRQRRQDEDDDDMSTTTTTTSQEYDDDDDTDDDSSTPSMPPSSHQDHIHTVILSSSDCDDI